MYSRILLLCMVISATCTDETVDGIDAVAAGSPSCCRHDRGSSSQFDRSSCGECPIEFGFYARTLNEEESGEDYSVNVGFLSGFFDEKVEFDIQLIPGTAGMSDVQLLGNRHVTINPEEYSHTLRLRLKADGVSQENDETFSLLITNFDHTQLGDNVTFYGAMNGTIIDSDYVSFGFSESDFKMMEGPNASIPVKVARHQKVRLANPVTLRVTPMTCTVNGELGNGTTCGLDVPTDDIHRADENDFDGSVIVVTFPADEDEESAINELSAEIPIVDDSIDEYLNEYFVASMEVESATNLERMNSSDVTRCIIADDEEGFAIGFDQPLYTFAEPDVPTAYNVTLSKNYKSERTFAVYCSITEPSTNVMPALIETGNSDRSYDFTFSFPGLTFPLIIPPDQETIPITFSLNSDHLPERLEGFQLSCGQVQGSPNFEFVNDSTLVLITDNDFAIVGFEQSTYYFMEGSGSHDVCIRVFNPPRNEELVFDIPLTYQSILTNTDTNDFMNIGNTSINFRAGFSPHDAQRRVCFRVNITDDAIHEASESFRLLLAHGGESQVSVLMNHTEIVIVNDDDVIIGFEHPEYTASENGGSVEVCARVVSPPDGTELVIDINVGYQAETITADKRDFTSSTAGFHFSNASRRNCIHITIMDDGIPENEESFLLTLNRQRGVAFDHPTTEIFILDGNFTMVTPSSIPTITTVEVDSTPTSFCSPTYMCIVIPVAVVVVLTIILVLIICCCYKWTKSQDIK